jgi:hypothetical protein
MLKIYWMLHFGTHQLLVFCHKHYFFCHSRAECRRHAPDFAGRAVEVAPPARGAAGVLAPRLASTNRLNVSATAGWLRRGVRSREGAELDAGVEPERGRPQMKWCCYGRRVMNGESIQVDARAAHGGVNRSNEI